jgi:hypothetical protein
MTPQETLDELLKSYVRYYDITREGATPPFDAEAAFHSHDEQFFISKAIRLSEAEAHEYVFFAAVPTISMEQAKALADRAWETGLARAKPHSGHRSTDVTLVVITGELPDDAALYLKKEKRSQSYRHSLHGWSDFRVIAFETASKKIACNRRGSALKDLFRNK